MPQRLRLALAPAAHHRPEMRFGASNLHRSSSFVLLDRPSSRRSGRLISRRCWRSSQILQESFCSRFFFRQDGVPKGFELLQTARGFRGRPFDGG